MKFRTIFYIFTASLFAVCLGMHFWNSYNGWGIATAKTLHPEVLAQLNDDDGGTTGGGTSTADPGDKPPMPNNHIMHQQIQDYFDKYEENFTDDNGGMFIDGQYTLGFNRNSLYTITKRTIFCRITFNPQDSCDSRNERTYNYKIEEGKRTADPGMPGTRT